MNNQRLELPASIQRGFTLIELLVVVSVLAAMAGIAVVAAGNFHTQARDELARTEMKEIAKAIYRFREDTGYFPKTGVFATDKLGYTGEEANLYNQPSSFNWLIEEPLKSDGSAVLVWRAELGRGWRGEYIERSGTSPLSTDNCDFSDLVAFDSGFEKARVIGISDVYERNFLSYGEHSLCFVDLVGGKWRQSSESGSPYFYEPTYFNAGNAQCPNSGDDCVVIRSFGQNGVDENGVDSSDDIVLVLKKNN